MASKKENRELNNQQKNKKIHGRIHSSIDYSDDLSKNKLVSLTDRENIINKAAYYLAENRGFTPGFEMADWLDAEIRVDDMLNQQDTETTI